jgi:hypothetical protein
MATQAAMAIEETGARGLADRLGLRFLDVTSFSPDPQILQSVPVELMFRYNFLPYREEEGRLVLVMADPSDLTVVDDLAILLNRRIQAAVGTPSAIGEASSAGRVRNAFWNRRPNRWSCRSSARATKVKPSPSIRSRPRTSRPSCVSSIPRFSTRFRAGPPTSTSRPATTRCRSSTASTACSSRP